MEYVLVGIIAFPVLLLALVGFRYLTRGTPVRRVRSLGGEALPAARDEGFRYAAELHSRVKMFEGNQVEILTAGDDIYRCLFSDLEAARQSITLQMYYCQPGRMADRFQQVLSERARAGVKVLFLHDAFGSIDLPKEYFDTLKAAGVHVAVFRPVQWYALEKAYNRSHIRVVVVDGETGYTGGFGIADKWYGDGRHEDQWRDTAVRFSGPAVLDHQATFAAGWAEATGDLLTGPAFFPVDKLVGASGGALAAILHSAPSLGSSVAERFLAITISAARETLYITNAYFVPDDDFVRLLSDAARRGVDVRVLNAGKHNDVKSTWYAGRHEFEALLAAGVRLYEYQPTMVHAKTIVVDRVWASVGTMNFDNRSLAFNDETNLVALNEDVGGRLHDVFLEDLDYAHEISLDEFRRRPLKDKALELGAHAISRIL
jgi:cardiolipin synthase A/B